MKLLFDENLSPKLPNRLSDIFSNIIKIAFFSATAEEICCCLNMCVQYASER